MKKTRARENGSERGIPGSALGFAPPRGRKSRGGRRGAAAGALRWVGRWARVERRRRRPSSMRPGTRATGRPARSRARREPRAVVPARAFEGSPFHKRVDVSRYAPVRGGGVALDDGPRGARPELGLLRDDHVERRVARERRADRGGRGGPDRDAAGVRRSARADAQSRRRESASLPETAFAPARGDAAGATCPRARTVDACMRCSRSDTRACVLECRSRREVRSPSAVPSVVGPSSSLR